MFELTNDQRVYFGLEPIAPTWDRVILKGDTYREESILYFEGDVIKRHIVSTDFQYKEHQYNEPTKGRTILLPKTSKGKEKKLSASVLEARQPYGIYVSIDGAGRLCIASYDTQTTFYNSLWETDDLSEQLSISVRVNDFIKTTPLNYLTDLNTFKKGKRRNAKFKPGDFFAFKISRSEYGFGRVILDVAAAAKKGLIADGHGLTMIMAKPVLIKIYCFLSGTKQVDVEQLEKHGALPSEYVMDNCLFYGEYEIIGYRKLETDELEFPMSYGKHIGRSRFSVFLQWGIIHKEMPTLSFSKYTSADNPFVPNGHPSRVSTNPYGRYSISFGHHYNINDIRAAINNNGYDFEREPAFRDVFDLRNPKNIAIRNEIMEVFGLSPNFSYNENCKLTKTIDAETLINKIS